MSEGPRHLSPDSGSVCCRSGISLCSLGGHPPLCLPYLLPPPLLRLMASSSHRSVMAWDHPRPPLYLPRIAFSFTFCSYLINSRKQKAGGPFSTYRSTLCSSPLCRLLSMSLGWQPTHLDNSAEAQKEASRAWGWGISPRWGCGTPRSRKP